MKEKLTAIMTKVKEFFIKVKDKVKKKANPRVIAGTCAVFLVGCAVLLNFVLFRDIGKSEDESGKKDMAVNLSQITDDDIKDTVGAMSSDVSDDYYAAVSLGKQQARDEAVEVLLEVSENESAEAEARESAMADINRIALDIEKESKIETMVMAKGFEKCVAVISGDSASVIVSSDTLTPGETAQISEIVYEAAGIVPSNLKIIEKK